MHGTLRVKRQHLYERKYYRKTGIKESLNISKDDKGILSHN